MIYFENGQFHFYSLRAHFRAHGEPASKYTNDRKYWEDFVAKWHHHESLTFSGVNPTNAQQARLGELNQQSDLDDLHDAEAAMFVEKGAIANDTEAPFLQSLKSSAANEAFLDINREDKKQEINTAYQSEMQQILAEYPEAETKTWDKQESEARAYLADNAASTPLLTRMATERGLTMDDMVARVIAKADAWIDLSGAATGKRQRLEAEINAADTLDAVRAIRW